MPRAVGQLLRNRQLRDNIQTNGRYEAQAQLEKLFDGLRLFLTHDFPLLRKSRRIWHDIVVHSIKTGAVSVLFSITLFLSAFLVFACEPMIGKMVLPSLGGAPSVWTTCVLFFQAMLLAGYAYAYLLERTSRLRTQLL